MAGEKKAVIARGNRITVLIITSEDNPNPDAIANEYRAVHNQTENEEIGLFLGSVDGRYSYLKRTISEKIFQMMKDEKIDNLLVQIVDDDGSLATENYEHHKVPCELQISLDSFAYRGQNMYIS